MDQAFLIGCVVLGLVKSRSWLYAFSEAPLILNKNKKFPCSKRQKQIGWRHSISFADIFTLSEVPLGGNSYWSNKRTYAAATHLKIIQ